MGPDVRAAAIRERIRERGGVSTIYDIAELASVDPSTVSRALTKPGRISSGTEARVRAAADLLDFHVNPMARALQTGKSRMLGLLVADITNPVIFDIIRGAEQEASTTRHTLVIAESQESGMNEAEVLERLLPSVDGIVLATTRLAAHSIKDLARRKPVVLINTEVEGVRSVLPEVEFGVNQLMEHLTALGHQSMVFLSGPASSWISERRWVCLRNAAERHGVEITEIGPNSPTVEGGRSLLRHVRATDASTVIAYNDLMAIGLMQEAAKAGIRIPAQLSVAGFDNIFGSELISPPLTTVSIDLITAGRRAVQKLLAPDAGGAPWLDDFLPTSLIIRGSTGPA